MTTRPSVVVVVPVYNGARHIAECIASIRAQTRTDWHAVIVNNRSTDDTSPIARHAAGDDERITVIDCEEHLPQAGNYNRAIEIARGRATFMKFIEADNWLYPHCLSAMLTVGQMSSGIGLIGAGYVHGDQPVGMKVQPKRSIYDGREAGRVHWAGHYILSSPGTLMYRSAVFDDPGLRFAHGHTAMDIDLHLRIAAHWDVGYVHEVLSFNRDEPGVTASFGNLMPGILGDYLCSYAHAHHFFEGSALDAHRAAISQNYYTILARALLALRVGPSVLRKHHIALARVSRGLELRRLAVALAAEFGKAVVSIPDTARSARRRLSEVTAKPPGSRASSGLGGASAQYKQPDTDIPTSRGDHT